MQAKEFKAMVADKLRCDAERAEGVIFVVLRELRAQLTDKEAHDVAAQLPSQIREMWEQDFGRLDEPSRLGRAEFLGRVRQWAGLPDEREAERATHAVFKTLQLALGSPTGTEGEAWDIFSVLRKDIKRLWLEAAEASFAAE